MQHTSQKQRAQWHPQPQAKPALASGLPVKTNLRAGEAPLPTPLGYRIIF